MQIKRRRHWMRVLIEMTHKTLVVDRHVARLLTAESSVLVMFSPLLAYAEPCIEKLFSNIPAFLHNKRLISILVQLLRSLSSHKTCVSSIHMLPAAALTAPLRNINSTLR